MVMERYTAVLVGGESHYVLAGGGPARVVPYFIRQLRARFYGRQCALESGRAFSGWAAVARKMDKHDR